MAYDDLTTVLSVTDINKLIKNTLDECFYQILVRGEISGYKISQTGHSYFDLKDSSSSISCILFHSLRTTESFKDGDLVIASGRISIYEKTGKLSFIVSNMKKEGDGELQRLYEKRKQYYQSLGWFDLDKKKEIPKDIKRIGVVTSSTGAVFHDILNVTRRRAPGVDILLFPCAVQGKGAEVTIASRIRQANNFDSVDVLIVGRGGGSKEDLMPFNEDEVITAIYSSHIPIISACGHETDWTIADYVADKRAGTPSIAAEMATETIFRRRESFKTTTETMNLLMKNKINRIKSILPSTALLSSYIEKKVTIYKSRIVESERLFYPLIKKFDNASLRLSLAKDEMVEIMSEKIEREKIRIEKEYSFISSFLPERIKDNQKKIEDNKKDYFYSLSMHFEKCKNKYSQTKLLLKELSPLTLLDRGFAYVTNKEGKVVKNTSDTKVGETLNIRLSNGYLNTKVTNIGENDEL